jgi:hypothetical protein
MRNPTRLAAFLPSTAGNRYEPARWLTVSSVASKITRRVSFYASTDDTPFRPGRPVRPIRRYGAHLSSHPVGASVNTAPGFDRLQRICSWRTSWFSTPGATIPGTGRLPVVGRSGFQPPTTRRSATESNSVPELKPRSCRDGGPPMWMWVWSLWFSHFPRSVAGGLDRRGARGGCRVRLGNATRHAGRCARRKPGPTRPSSGAQTSDLRGDAFGCPVLRLHTGPHGIRTSNFHAVNAKEALPTIRPCLYRSV